MEMYLFQIVAEVILDIDCTILCDCPFYMVKLLIASYFNFMLRNNYLWLLHLFKIGVRDKTQITFNSGIGVIFGVKKYADRLLKACL